MPLAQRRSSPATGDAPTPGPSTAYKSTGGYATLEKALGLQPAQIIDEVKKSQPARPRRRRLPHRDEVELRPQGQPQAQVPGGERRRVRAGHVQGPLHPRERPAHAAGGHRHRLLRARRAHRLHLRRGASSCFQAERLQKAIDEAYRAGIFGKKVLGRDFALDVYVVRGAGAYICGEETGMLESLEGKKGWPRLKPPFPAVVGLFGCPTVVNNVETLAAVPAIFQNGAEWFAKLGPEKSGGTRMVCLSGSVNRPGVFEVMLSTTVRELIESPDFGQGMPAGRKVKAVIPGGSSAPVLTADELDVALEFEALKALQNMAGSGGVIVMDDATCMVRSLWRVSRFYAEESCGQCTPCREGTPWMTRILRKIEEGRGEPGDLETLLNVAQSIAPYPPMGLGRPSARWATPRRSRCTASS